MKKWLCALLAIGMLCATAAFVGCKKDNGGKNGTSSSREIGENVNEAPASWNPDWD